MNIGGICYELTNLFDRKQKVRTSGGKVLESSHKTSVGMRINKGNAQWESLVVAKGVLEGLK